MDPKLCSLYRQGGGVPQSGLGQNPNFCHFFDDTPINFCDIQNYLLSLTNSRKGDLASIFSAAINFVLLNPFDTSLAYLAQLAHPPQVSWPPVNLCSVYWASVVQYSGIYWSITKSRWFYRGSMTLEFLYLVPGCWISDNLVPSSKRDRRKITFNMCTVLQWCAVEYCIHTFQLF